MMSRWRNGAAIAWGLVCWTSAAGAQTAATMEKGLDEVIVTAQKRPEQLQDTPIAISVLDAAALADRGVSTLADLVDGQVPSLRVTPVGGRPSSLVVGMRGVVPSDATQISRDTAVGVYVDGVFLGRVQGLGAEFIDVERIEVLKGPQGSLFGRNAVGGAINIVSRAPAGEFGLVQAVGLRNFDGANAAISVDFPEWKDLSAKLSLVYNKRDGWIDNPLPNQADFNAYERYGGRGTLRWEPTEAFSVSYAIDLTRDASTPNHANLLEIYPGAPRLGPRVALQPGRLSSIDVGVVLEESVGEVEGHSVTASWRPDAGIELRSITSFRQLSQSQFDNGGANTFAYRAGSNFGRYSLADVEQEQVSQEFQLIGGGDSFRYVAGLYYLKEDASDSAYTPNTLRWSADGLSYSVLAAPVGSTPPPSRASIAESTSLAAYGQATWTPPIADGRLELTGGARFTSDQKDGRLTKLNGADTDRRFEFESERIDPTATLAFEIAQGIDSYVRWGTAYRAGGANSRSATFRTFDEEEVATWELGLKAEWFDRRARIGIALYETDYRNLQIDFTDPSNPSATETVNTDDPATIRGVEIDFAAQPVRALTLSAAYAYTDAELPPQLNPFSGRRESTFIVYTPEHAATIAADLKLTTALGPLTIHGDIDVRSGYHAGATLPLTDAATVGNVRVTLDPPFFGRSDSMSISAWVRNIADEAHVVYDFAVTGTGLINGRVGGFNEPRTFGIDLTMRY